MRLVACFLVSGALLLASIITESTTAQPPDKQPGGKAGKGKKLDPGQMFDVLAKGKDTIDLTVVRFKNTDLETYVRDNKLDPTKITRAQYVAFIEAKASGALRGADGIDVAAEQKFRVYDVNGDGFLDRSEVPAGLRAAWTKYDRNGDGLINLEEFKAYYRDTVQRQSAPGNPGGGGSLSVSAAEEVLRAAGLNADGDALQDYFLERTRAKADLQELLAVARQLGDPDADKRAKATAKLLASGPWAVPALHHVINELDDSLTVQRARHCLEWLEGKRGTEVPVAAARLLALRKPETAAGTLLAFLPLADNQAVADGVKAALGGIAARPGKTDPALLAALNDPLPLRRAVAAEVLADSGKPEVLPPTRKLLADPSAQVRLRAALALTRQLDEPAVAVLIDLLGELPAGDSGHAETALRQLAGAWAPNAPAAGDTDVARKIRREVWSAWWRVIDGPALLAAFRQRTLTEEEAGAARKLIDQLGDNDFGTREVASAGLVAQGVKVVGLLRAAKSPNPEHARRVEVCVQEITQNEARDKLPLSAPALLATRKPAGATDALLAYLAFTDDRAMTTEVARALTSLLRSQGTADAALVKALTDPLAARRSAAAEALVGAGGAAHPAVRKLLTDAEPGTRLAVATALLHARDREAVPALIDLVAVLPQAQALQADALLRGVAGEKAPARSPGADAVAREKLAAAWQVWWKEHGATVDLAAPARASDAAGLTVVAELGPNGSVPIKAKAKDSPFKKKTKEKKGGVVGPKNPPAGKDGDGLAVQKGGGKGNPQQLPANEFTGTDRLVALDGQGRTQWQIEKLEYPIDFQLLAADRVLIAEYYGKRVTERDLKGNVVWEAANLPGAPINVQRLANGNTFIVLYNSLAQGGTSLVEMDRAGKTVTTITGASIDDGGGKGSYIRAAYKLANGEVRCLMSTFPNGGTCCTLDAAGKQVKRYPLTIPATVRYFGNIDVTPQGHVVVAQQSAVEEYDPDGKLVWRAVGGGNRATRLASGTTLLAAEASGVFELDAAGKTVWHYQPPAGYQAVRARREATATAQPGKQ
jgi:HEAT repeat protein